VEGRLARFAAVTLGRNKGSNVLTTPLIWDETPVLGARFSVSSSSMAHHPMFGSDPAKPADSAAEARTAEARAEGEAFSPGAGAVGESDLAELAAKFAAHGGGRVSPELSAELALEIVLNEIVEEACLATGASGAAIVLERGGEWVCRASSGGNAPQLGARLDTEAGLTGACVKTRKVQYCDDAQTDGRADMEACRSLGVRSVMILPLLLDDELAGVFEVFSSSPWAFGERDERTLEALSQRVVKYLKGAAEALSDVEESSQAARSNFIAGNIVAGNIVAGSNLAEEIVAQDFPAKNVVAESMVTREVVTEKQDDATSGAHQRSPDGALLQAANEAASSRGINFITWVLSAAVIAFAVLLTVLVGQRLGGGKAAARAHPPGASAAPSAAGAEEQSAAGAEAAASPTSGSKSAGGSSGTPRSGTLSMAPTTGASHATASSPPAGSLVVYENGKEIFRMPPTVEQGEVTAATGTSGDAATSTDGPGMQPASAVEEVSPEAAEGSLVHRVEPDYPEDARRQEMQGPVVLDVRTDRDGAVEEAKLVSGQRLLADAAIAAVKQWRFRPRTVNGQPVEMQTKVTLNFKLAH
jgi:TonB family protein